MSKTFVVLKYLPYSKNIGGEKTFGQFGKLQHFAKFCATFHNFQHIAYTNGLLLASFFLPNFLQFLFTNLFTA